MLPRLIRGVEFAPRLEDIAAQIRLSAYPELEEEVRACIDAVSAVADPRAVYRVCSVERLGEPAVNIGGRLFRSPDLYRRLDGVSRATVYVATCGSEIDGIDLSVFDPMAFYWVLILKERALATVTRELNRLIREALDAPSVYHLHPGSAGGNVWSIDQQPVLFQILADALEPEVPSMASATASPTEEVDRYPPVAGVRLRESFLMDPDKSVSGVAFASTEASPTEPHA